MQMQKVQEVCKELFQERNYTVQEIGEDDTLGWYIYGKTEQKRPVHLYILSQAKLNVDVIKFYYSVLRSNLVKKAILVYKYTVTTSVSKLIETLDLSIELFHIHELSYNLLKHKWVPRHEKIDSVKKNTMKYPILKRTDPVSKFMGFKSGDIIRIHRNDGSLYYRFVK